LVNREGNNSLDCFVLGQTSGIIAHILDFKEACPVERGLAMSPALITENLFIAPGVDLQKEDPAQYDSLITVVNFKKADLQERWYSSEGKQILAQWRGSKFNRAVLDRLIGRYYGQTDLRGVPLRGYLKSINEHRATRIAEKASSVLGSE
jgi:hypothetical protein